MVQPFDYMHKSGNGGLVIQSYARRYSGGFGTPEANFLLATPLATGDLPFRLARLGHFISAAGATTTNIGIYDSTSLRNLYPNNLVADMGAISYAVLGNAYTPANDITLPAGGLYWLVTLASAALGQHVSLGDTNEEASPGFLGTYDPGANPPVAIAEGWRVARAFGALPATFPAGATGVNNQFGRFPAIIIDPF